MTRNELQALNPSAPTLEVPCHPTLIPEHVKRFAVQRASRHIVTDEQQDELRSFAPSASVFIEVNPAAPMANAQVMASEYGLSCPNMVNVDEPSSESLPESARPNPRYLAQPANAPAASAPKSLPRIAVCARPPGIAGNEWYGGPGIDGTATNADDHAKEIAKATVMFYLDPAAPPESVWHFGKDTKVRCNGKAPIPYDKFVASVNASTSQQTGSTSSSTTSSSSTTTTPKNGGGQTTSSSSPTGQGPPLSTFETIARNLALAGALSQMDTSGNPKDPNGHRNGIPGGKSLAGFSFPLLQAGVSTLQILSSVGLNPKSFVETILKNAKQGQRTLIKEADEKMMKVADELIHDFSQYEVAKGLEEMQTIMPYTLGEKFTKDLGGKFQAHKIFEKQAFEYYGWSEKIKNAPSIILTDTEHKAITTKLNKFWDKVRKGEVEATKERVRELYKDVYKDHPHWLDAIESLINEIPK